MLTWCKPCGQGERAAGKELSIVASVAESGRGCRKSQEGHQDHTKWIGAESPKGEQRIPKDSSRVL